MKRSTLIATLALAGLGLSACDNHEAGPVNAKICADFKTTSNTNAPATDAASPVDECLRRWAYSLAGARDGADVVGDAVVAACGPALSRWNQTTLSQPAQAGGPGAAPGPEQGVSLVTGQPTSPLLEHNAYAHTRALFYVIQARAGRCAPPPVNNGVPVGS
jgi:hypothetical protein